VLSARPAEVERDLAYVGLRDLLEDVLPEVSPMLPAPRRHALESALLLQEANRPVPDARASPVAVERATRS
jgi:hypothetical protein